MNVPKIELTLTYADGRKVELNIDPPVARAAGRMISAAYLAEIASRPFGLHDGMACEFGKFLGRV